MKLDSKYFDSLRAKPDGAEAPQPAGPVCQWKGCQSVGRHRAPMGRGREGQYYLFCLDHVRQFNASYNYFEGWSNADVEAFQKDAVIGHRPTWKTGLHTGAQGTAHGSGHDFQDPHAFFAWRSRRFGDGEASHRRLKPLERKSLEALDLAEGVDRAQIKARFKELVKRHHPDANGGDKRSENRLREIIQAYNYLKQAGLV
ncbi:MAG: J domain-containing protein [Hyphomonadaceae bacterium]|jgi:curved DNA-binding protein CbpA|nr:J domain-containing protein [Hyphomonadaceae bacterium]